MKEARRVVGCSCWVRVGQQPLRLTKDNDDGFAFCIFGSRGWTELEFALVGGGEEAIHPDRPHSYWMRFGE